jgi:hypothetical protein
MNLGKSERIRDMRKSIRSRRVLSFLQALLLLGTAIVPLTSYAVSYQPPLFHRQYDHEASMKGDLVYLFHSGTTDIKRTIHVSDVLPAYRIDTSCEVKEVGKIRILSYVGETYLKGEVVDGEIRPNDIAKKNGISCLVISAGVCNH